MDHATEVDILRELLDLQARGTPFLDDSWVTTDVQRYRCAEVFARERAGIACALPQIAAHSSQLPGSGAFLTLELAGKPLLLVRDEAGAVRAFLNVCRHRGAQLVGERSGCRRRFSCPYHAWTWDSGGSLVAVPHEKSGFPGLQREAFGLHRVPCQEYGGWIWVVPGGGAIDVDFHLGDMAADILGMGAQEYEVFACTERDTAANWKILVEGGIESYHFRVAHRQTIAGLFLDNLSSYRCFGPHIRSVLPRSSLPELRDRPEAEWRLGRHANVLYTLFPGSQFLLQEDHFVWIQGMPLAPDRTLLRIATMVPKLANTPANADYWRRHHHLTSVTLEEDFVLAEGIQRGLASGANAQLNFGRFEGALARFKNSVEEALARGA
ncbi:MAG: ring-hydroxylating oxygenase subunit alpha [Halioglobus sp.]|nr:ring-hydroxylating oxygenase subunit alpha [Halioglobus sp.]|tara:strand:+ start:2711 stop:3853 length:1143 start_codon:yes stop_codon:yes gene_type:complete